MNCEGWIYGGGDFRNSATVGVFGESVALKGIFWLRQLLVSLANRWILTRGFELR